EGGQRPLWIRQPVGPAERFAKRRPLDHQVLVDPQALGAETVEAQKPAGEDDKAQEEKLAAGWTVESGRPHQKRFDVRERCGRAPSISRRRPATEPRGWSA